MNIKVEESNIPLGVLCVFGEKIPKGIRYVIGSRKDDLIKIHFSSRTTSIKNIISYQLVLNGNNKVIKK